MEEMMGRVTLKLLAEDDRPREKLVTLGKHNLSDAELVAIILGSGNRNETAVQLAQRMLSDAGNDIAKLAKMGVGELKKYKGVGEAKAVNIAAAFELGRRRKDVDKNERQKITSSKDAYDILNLKLSDLPHEEFRILLLNRANHVIKEECISKGGVSGTVVDIRIVCKSAIENYASGIILSHNHPSGQVQPSMEDRSLTKKIREALGFFDIKLLDHIIVGEGKYYSFADEGAI
jgi:DNA repair protein RadC